MLTVEEKNRLELELRKTREASEYKRLCVILGCNDGITKTQLAKDLRISYATVCKYVSEYATEQKTRNEPRGGRESLLNEEQTSQLTKHLSETTYLKVKDICAYVLEQFGVEYSRSGMTDWLEAHGFVYKRPKKVPGKINPEQQAKFIQEYQELKGDLAPEEEIYFVDAVHPAYQSQAVCGWIQKGEQKTLPTTGKQERLHLVGAICLEGMQVFTQEYKRVDAEAMLDFIKKLEERSPGKKIHVIMDNARSNKNKIIGEYVGGSRVKISYLPAYSPNLNPIERLWKIMRENKMYNRYYESSVTFFQEIRSFFKDQVPEKMHSWRSRINDNFEVIKLNPIKLAG